MFATKKELEKLDRELDYLKKENKRLEKIVINLLAHMITEAEVRKKTIQESIMGNLFGNQ